MSLWSLFNCGLQVQLVPASQVVAGPQASPSDYVFLCTVACRHNPLNIFAAHEIAGFCDPSVATKMTVQFNLFGGTSYVQPRIITTPCLCHWASAIYGYAIVHIPLCLCLCCMPFDASATLYSNAPPANPALHAVVLFSGTILKLGTKVHHDQLLAGIDSLGAVGCFALTELGYGMCSLAVPVLCLLQATAVLLRQPCQSDAPST